MLIEVRPVEAVDHLVDYLSRLGCRVERRAPRLAVTVTFPDTVEDEAASMREWCDSWSSDRRRASLIEEPASV